jgi:hypothetical protein
MCIIIEPNKLPHRTAQSIVWPREPERAHTPIQSEVEVAILKMNASTSNMNTNTNTTIAAMRNSDKCLKVNQ